MSEQEIYIEAIRRTDPADRGRFLDEACDGDSALRERLEKLIRRFEISQLQTHQLMGHGFWVVVQPRAA